MDTPYHLVNRGIRRYVVDILGMPMNDTLLGFIVGWTLGVLSFWFGMWLTLREYP